jgi:hypothetical protein
VLRVESNRVWFGSGNALTASVDVVLQLLFVLALFLLTSEECFMFHAHVPKLVVNCWNVFSAKQNIATSYLGAY